METGSFEEDLIDRAWRLGHHWKQIKEEMEIDLSHQRQNGYSQVRECHTQPKALSAETSYAMNFITIAYREAGASRAITQADPAVQVNLCGIEEHHAVVNPLLAHVAQIHMPIIQRAPAGRGNQEALILKTPPESQALRSSPVPDEVLSFWVLSTGGLGGIAFLHQWRQRVVEIQGKQYEKGRAHRED